MAVAERPDLNPQEPTSSAFEAFVRANTDLDFIYGIDPSRYLVVGGKKTKHSRANGTSIIRQYFAPSSDGSLRQFSNVATLEIAGGITDFRLGIAGKNPDDRLRVSFLGDTFYNAAFMIFPLADVNIEAPYNGGLLRFNASPKGRDVEEDKVWKATEALKIGDYTLYVPAEGVGSRVLDGRLVLTRRAESVSLPVNLDNRALARQLVSEETRSKPLS